MFADRTDAGERLAARLTEEGVDADLVFDLRFLTNPYFVEELREKDGRDQEIQEYVLAQPEAGKFISLFQEMSEFMLPQYQQEGKSYLTIGLGCTGGHHRSVSMAEALAGTVGRDGWLHYFAFDGDADRCMLTDEKGEIIGCDHLTAWLGGHTAISDTAQERPGKPVASYRNLRRLGFSSVYARPNYLYAF